MADGITQPELVVHLAAAVEGKRADRSVDQLHRVLDAAIGVLGVTEPVAGYPDRLPASIGDFPATQAPAVIRRHPDRPIQLVVRRVRHDMLLLSALITPAGAQGWHDMDLLWDDVLARADVGPLLGMRRLFLGKVPDDVADLADAGSWSRSGAVTRDGSCAVWTLEPSDSPRDRRIGVLARGRDDHSMTRFVWWQGDSEIPSLVRFLLHSVRIRDQFLVWDNGSHTREFRADTDGALDVLRSEPDEARRRHAVDLLRELSADIGAATGRLLELQRTVEIGLDNAKNAVDWRDGPYVPGTPPAEEVTLADRLLDAVSDDMVYLTAVGLRAAVYREFDREPVGTRARAAQPPIGQFLRLGFSADVIGYGGRAPAGTDLIRERLDGLFQSVLDRMGADRSVRTVATDGDQTIGLFPVDTDPVVALPGLISTTALLLDADNQRHTDRLALRMAVGTGLASVAAHGFRGRLVTDLARLVNCRQIRQAATRDDGDLTVIVADGLYQDVVAAGYPMPAGMEFRRVRVVNKEYRGYGWIWSAPGPSAQSTQATTMPAISPSPKTTASRRNAALGDTNNLI